MKIVSPKGIMSKEMWQRVARNIDNIVQNGMNLLSMKENDPYSVLSIPSEKEIIRWRAVLRQSKFLQCNNDMVVNIQGNILNTDMHYFSENLKDRRKLYFEMALTKNI